MAQRMGGVRVGSPARIFIKWLLIEYGFCKLARRNASRTRAVSTFNNGIKACGLKSSSELKHSCIKTVTLLLFKALTVAERG